MREVVVDTNVLIYYLDNTLTLDSRRTFEDIVRQELGFINTITYIECLTISSEKQEEILRMRQLVESFSQVRITDGLVEDAVDLCQRFKLRAPDALVAATALALKCPLMTFDSGVFIVFPALKSFASTVRYNVPT